MPKAEINERNEFREIMNDFTNPLEIFREAIQNSLDENAKVITITVSNNDSDIGKSLDIIIEDDGYGLPSNKFENFFDLGRSTKKNRQGCIGEKGHGTKIFYNSNKVIVESWVEGIKFISVLDSPYQKIYNNDHLNYSNVEKVENIEGKLHGMRITINGYLKNTSNSPTLRFSHPAIKDYILWFTGFGSIENEICNKKSEEENRILYLKSFDSGIKKLQDEFKFKVNSSGHEEIRYGHVFPKECFKITELKKKGKDLLIKNWEQLFCKRLYKDEIIIEGMDTSIQILIWAEGDKCKRLYNPLIQERVSSTTKEYQYKVNSRYGFWVCKNYIPIQKVDNWITGKGSYTKFHAFINYNSFNLTANRSSIENTRPEDLSIIQKKVDEIFQEVTKDKDYISWREIEEKAAQERSAEVEKNEFEKRVKRCKKRKRIKLGNQQYFEPEDEGEVAMLFNGVLEQFREAINLEILDYNTYKGIDFLARDASEKQIDGNDNTIGYIELKLNLEKTRFNHSFRNLRMIVCFNNKGLQKNDVYIDLNGHRAEVKKSKGKYFLNDLENEIGHNINIFIIKDFLEENEIKFQ